jgi:hypothetical protein
MWDEFKKIEAKKTKKQSPSAKALGEGQPGGPYFQPRPVYSSRPTLKTLSL